MILILMVSYYVIDTEFSFMEMFVVYGFYVVKFIVVIGFVVGLIVSLLGFFFLMFRVIYVMVGDGFFFR